MTTTETSHEVRAASRGSPPPEPEWATLDGNEAAARVAYALSEVATIYPITPASYMGELADAWSAAGEKNLWGAVPEVIEMQSEAGAAGALHGALITGAQGTTFTASQGLLLMLPNMYKIAGELTPTVIHVAARTIATHALSIFGDHSDVMAARATGFAMLCASSVEQAQDFAAVAHAATLESRVPFLHFFDGFRTSHEIDHIRLLSHADMAAMIDPSWIEAHRKRGLTPDAPVLRGSSQNPDVFFQAREAVNPYYDSVPAVVAGAFERLAELTGRRYGLVDYEGAPDADRVIVLMGSGAGAVGETVEALREAGQKVGLVKVRLFRPFPVNAFLAAIPSTVRSIAVLDRTKEPGAIGEPLYQDVVTALAEGVASGVVTSMPRVIGGRYGLASKEFTPAMAKAVYDEIARDKPTNHFTVGIIDDVTRKSLVYDPEFDTDHSATRAVFFGLGSDGTVSANKSTAKIIADSTDLYTQAYFVYDSKKSGAVTVSHLRFDTERIRSTYLIRTADFVACHQFNFLETQNVLDIAEPGATFLLNSPYGPDEVWDHIPIEVQRQILDKGIRMFVVDAQAISHEVGTGGRINSVMMPCFFALTDLMPLDLAVDRIKHALEKSYGKRGKSIVERNNKAVDRALAELREVTVPSVATSTLTKRNPVPDVVPDFVERITARLIAGEGDLLPVSALPVDGTFPTGTARYEKRKLAHEIPIWDSDLCIDCGKCAIMCPHAAIRMKVYEPGDTPSDPPNFPSKKFRSKDLKDYRMTIQVAPDDCTGCGICVDVCPATSKEDPSHKSLNMEPAEDHRRIERANWDAFLDIPQLPRDLLGHDTVKGAVTLEPLFEFSGACPGCGETQYLNLLTQLYGDRALVANATGCSSIYGGNLPTTPWTTNSEGRGPAWANSLFEDNAEFGLGMRLAADFENAMARSLVGELASEIGDDLSNALLTADQSTETGIDEQRGRVAELNQRLHRMIDAGPGLHDERVARLLTVSDELVKRSVWIVGGDGWAYDIGFGGIDHVLASGMDVNLLVLDTEMYSNTGGQASKATQRGAVAKFATSGKPTRKKDLGQIAMSYGHVYVAQIAIGANEVQTVKVFNEAEAWDGPSLIIAYSTCVVHHIDMATSMQHQKNAAKSGYWPLFRYHPAAADNPFRLDSHDPSIPVSDFMDNDGRFTTLVNTDPERAEELFALGQDDADERWETYKRFAETGNVGPDYTKASEVGVSLADPNKESNKEPPSDKSGGDTA